ncbi:MAG: polyprenyl synthetase family protein [Caldilineaceae bacterium]|nr:polyprenyl synthetase family protein [Caldilineaceae bacterium]
MIETQPVAVQQLLAPVQAKLHQVEQKMKEVDSAIFAPLANAFLDLIGSGGKRLRPALALLTAGAAGVLPAADASANAPSGDNGVEQGVIALAAAIEMLHTATLVHDDVIDGALLRRGAPTLNATWSGGSTVLAGNYMFGTAALFAAETADLRVIHLFSDTLEVIVTGELNQLRARYHFDQPKEIYYERIYAKTASLFCAATKGGALLAGLADEAVEAMRQYGYYLGMAFQIIDDVLDFTSDEATLGKPAGSDLLGGTLTLPFFYYAQQQPDPAQYLADLLALHNQADAEEDVSLWQTQINQIVAGVRNGSAITQAYAEADHFLTKAHEALTVLPPSIYRESLHGLCDFVVQRRY